MDTDRPALPARGRIAWLDLARAISILLVVLYHVGVTAGPELLGGTGSGAAWLWANFNIALIPLRMPLFFLIAGALAAGAIHRPWSKVVRPRVLDLLWPYLLWCLLFAVTGWPRYEPQEPLSFLWNEITGMLVIGSPYWFIAVLPLFFVVARLGRERRVVLVAIAVVAYALAPFLQARMLDAGANPDLIYGVFQITDNALWYMLGFAVRDGILAIGDRFRVLSALAAGLPLLLAFCALAFAVMSSDRSLAFVRALELVTSLVGLLACTALVPVLARCTALDRAGASIGRRTLQIYLVHPIALNLIVIVWVRAGADELPLSFAQELLIVPVITAIAVLIALLADRIVERWGPVWLFKAPRARRGSGDDADALGTRTRPG